MFCKMCWAKCVHLSPALQSSTRVKFSKQESWLKLITQANIYSVTECNELCFVLHLTQMIIFTCKIALLSCLMLMLIFMQYASPIMKITFLNIQGVAS
jgi:hypothetical protein